MCFVQATKLGAVSCILEQYVGHRKSKCRSDAHSGKVAAETLTVRVIYSVLDTLNNTGSADFRVTNE